MDITAKRSSPTLRKVFLRNFSIAQPRAPLSLDAGAGKERFVVVVEPGPSSIYTGSAVDAANNTCPYGIDMVSHSLQRRLERLRSVAFPGRRLCHG